ncbi:MAG: imidazole glycerol phosphate synthase subunit HisF [Chloroflexi bacterium]|nr:imidazole glycerol phosphate synthase subunit HisF [Chloroflexota bacterium]MBE3114265.1 imidazole glycerol phosphate synthase subunit HisF [Actinomycetota bacterium]
MITKRIIPCLDVDKGRVVKGINFVDIKDAGDPVELAAFYDKEGADEIVFLDITASHERRKTVVDLASKTAEKVFIPYTIGGGISRIEHIREILRKGADKISLNTAAVRDPSLINRASKIFGSQCIVVAIDAKYKNKDFWEVYINGGRTPTGINAVDWAKRVEELGAGEILLTSMDKDGTKDGYDIDLTGAITSVVNIPVIASGGAGKLEHLRDVIKYANADAVLVASIFHYRQYTIREAKEYLKSEGINVRI